MKTTKTSIALSLTLGIAMLAAGLTGCSKDDTTPESVATDTSLKEATINYTYDDATMATIGTCIDTLPYEPLSAEEESALIQMREEEYLAHDVYTALFGIYTKPVFTNIASSELTHTNAVKLLLDKYGLPDPAAGHVQGLFTDPALQTLYNNLVESGSQSLLAGLIVGATIEDLDIYDLQELLLVVDNQDITLVFENLERGSRNHMRSFYTNILKNGGDYTPQYISLEEFNVIITTPHETGR